MARKNTAALTTLTIYLLIAGIAIPIIAVIYKKASDTQIQPQFVRSIIFAEDQEEVNAAGASRESLLARIKEQFISTTLPSGHIKNIYFVESAGSERNFIGGPRFLGTISTTIPSVVGESLENQFDYGLHEFDGIHGFFVFKVTDFEEAANGMLEWEGTLGEEMIPFISGVEASSFNLGNGGIFQDATAENQPSRVLRTTTGEIAFLYTFPNRDYLIITDGGDTLSEVLKRLYVPNPIIK